MKMIKMIYFLVVFSSSLWLKLVNEDVLLTPCLASERSTCPSGQTGLRPGKKRIVHQTDKGARKDHWAEFFCWGGQIWSGLNVNFLFGTENRMGHLRNEINIFKRASRVSGSLAPRVSGRKEVATEPARQISIMIMYGIWEKSLATTFSLSLWLWLCMT